jgi:hypothetical protein
VAYALVFITLLILLARRTATDHLQRQWLPMVACGLMGLGVLPWLLVWSRPEQPILLALCVTLLLAAPGRRPWSAHNAPSAAIPWRPFVMAALWSLSLSYHFKTLAILPLYLLAIAFSAHGAKRRWPSVVAGLAVIALAAVGAHYWFLRLACPGDPLLAAFYSNQNLGVQILLGKGPGQAFWALASNFQLPIYIALTAPNAMPMDDWLVAHRISEAGQTSWAVVILFLWLVGFVLAASRLFPALATLARQRRFAADTAQRSLMAIACFGCASAYCMFQVARNDYEASFVLPLLLLSCLYSLSLPAETDTPEHNLARRGLTIFARSIGLAMLLSVAGIGVLFAPPLWHAFGQSGYLPDQPNSVAIRGYAGMRARILATARICAIEPDAAHPRLLIDSVTYFAMMRAPLPDHKTSVLDLRYSGLVKDPAFYLAANRSSGVVVGCQWLSGALRARARTKDGQICCLAPGDFAPTQ